MTTYSMKLLKCPACGGPVDPPSGQSSMKCPYCGNAIVIPESLRKQESGKKESSSNIFGDLGSMVGYGTQWAEVVQLAQSGQKEEALKKYLSFSSVGEADARRTIEGLANTQTYAFTGTGYDIAPMMTTYAETAKTVTKWSMWFTCGITAFIMLITLLIIGVVLIATFGSLWAAFNSF
jgi:predicted RNA-binding Zn-ribbon protein involved in translation (DUF1610 family)